jgi:hypothetical protein
VVVERRAALTLSRKQRPGPTSARRVAGQQLLGAAHRARPRDPLPCTASAWQGCGAQPAGDRGCRWVRAAKAISDHDPSEKPDSTVRQGRAQPKIFT